MATLFYTGLLVLGVVLLVVTVARLLVGGLENGSGQADRANPVGGALRILDERYAAGELSTEEYRHRLHVLEARTR